MMLSLGPGQRKSPTATMGLDLVAGHPAPPELVWLRTRSSRQTGSHGQAGVLTGLGMM